MSDEIAKIRARLKERLQLMEISGKEKPYVNELNIKPRSFPIFWIPIALAIAASIAALRGW